MHGCHPSRLVCARERVGELLSIVGLAALTAAAVVLTAPRSRSQTQATCSRYLANPPSSTQGTACNGNPVIGQSFAVWYPETTLGFPPPALYPEHYSTGDLLVVVGV